MKSALLLLLFATVASSQNNVIENGIYRYLQQFRLDMECGFPQSGIPVLAPLRHARLPVNINLNEFAYVVRPTKRIPTDCSILSIFSLRTASRAI